MAYQIISQFIPILVITLGLMFKNDFVRFSNTIIGKIIAIFIVLFYIEFDKPLGLLSCALIILYYQSDFVEKILNEYDLNQYKKEESELITTTITENFDNIDSILSYFPTFILDKFGYTEYSDIPNPPNAIDEFRKRNCNKNHLNHKNVNVKLENVGFIFPELDFKQDECNPCDKNCIFSIVENKLGTEHNLIPIQSNNAQIVKL